MHRFKHRESLKQYNIFRGLNLRLVLVLPFILQIFLAVGLTGWLSLRNGRKAINDLAKQLHEELTARVEQRFDDYVRIPHLINHSNKNNLKSGLLKIEDFDLLQYHFWQQIQLFPEASYISFGNRFGEFVGIERMDEGKFNLEIKQIKLTGNDLHTQAIDELGNTIKKKLQQSKTTTLECVLGIAPLLRLKHRLGAEYINFQAEKKSDWELLQSNQFTIIMATYWAF